MKHNKLLLTGISIVMSLSLSLAGCSNQGSNNSNSTAGSASEPTNILQTSNTTIKTTSTSLETTTVEYDAEDYYFNWKIGNYKTIDVSNGSVTITQSGIYEITGTLKEGNLTVNVDKNVDDGIVYLVLNGVDISSANSAPIYIKEAKKVVMLLESSTQNTVKQGSSVSVDESGDPSAAIFSKANITITGEGKLTVISDYNDGITSKDKLKITDGTIIIKAKSDGIVGKDLLAVEKAEITITAGKDGIRATNETDEGKGNIVIEDGSFNITANNDGLQAYALLQINGGIFDITTGGGYTGSTKVNPNGGMFERPGNTTTTANAESKKALKGSQTLIVNNGTFNISSVDDALNSNGDITITGGTFTIESGDDGIHSGTNITITAGNIVLKNCYEGMEAKNITVDNGKIDMTTSDDAFNVNNSSGLLSINGGKVYINTGGDGVDSNGSIQMTGGTVYVNGPTNDGNGAIDYDGTFTITGGSIIAAGSSGMAEVPQSGTQASMLMYYNTTQAAGTTLTLKDEEGNIVATFTPVKQYASVAISAPGLLAGSTYTLYSGDKKIVSYEQSSNTTFVNESGVTTNQSRGPGGMGMGDPGGGNGGPGKVRR